MDSSPSITIKAAEEGDMPSMEVSTNTIPDETDQNGEDQTDIEVSVQISDSSGTLDNRYSFVILDLNEEPGDPTSPTGKQRAKDKKGVIRTSAPILEANEDNVDEDVTAKNNGRKPEADKRRKSAVSTQGGANASQQQEESTRWKGNISMAKVRYFYITHSVWGCLHFLARIVNFSVFSRSGIDPDAWTIIFTVAMSLLVYLHIWACFRLKQTATYEWFKTTLCVSCVSTIIALIYFIVAISRVVSVREWTFVMGVTSSIGMVSVFVLLMTSLLISIYLIFAAMYTGTSDESEREERVQPESTERHEDFNTTSAFRCVIVLFLPFAVTTLAGVALAIYPCSVVWLYAMSTSFVLLILIVIGIRNHMREEKSEFLWLAFLWISVVALITSFLTFIYVSVDLSRLDEPCHRPKFLAVMLDIVLLLATLVDVVVLFRMVWLATEPLRQPGERKQSEGNGSSNAPIKRSTSMVAETERTSKKRWSDKPYKTM